MSVPRTCTVCGRGVGLADPVRFVTCSPEHERHLAEHLAAAGCLRDAPPWCTWCRMDRQVADKRRADAAQPTLADILSKK